MEIQAIAGVSRLFFGINNYCRVEIPMFSEAATLLPDERTSTSIQLAFRSCVLLL